MKTAEHETLGNAVVPSNYSLTIEPDMKNFKFNGRVAIKARAKTATRTISLNAKELKIKEAMVKCGGVEQKAAVGVDPDKEKLTLRLPSPVSGSIEIVISYQGIHNDMLYGFYRSSYTYKGRKGWILTTQFEAPDARAAFPCFDEPEFKATFDISLLVDRGLEAISNMHVKSVRPSGKRTLYTFHTSPRMSTYLVYMGVGRFERISTMLDGIKISVVTAPGMIDKGRIPLEYAKKFLADLQSYFGIRYPLRKLDLIAVPDFGAGAMENWGAITFRAEQMLIDPKGSSVSFKQTNIDTIAHELVHQWFGDLVTMQWWNDMWLNESFATFVSSLAIDRVIPEWKTMVRYRRDTDHNINRGMFADQVMSTHPISVHVGNVGEIEKLFDDIGYDKGGAMLFMLQDFIGNTIFRKGLRRYLKKHAYSNTTRSDLWDAIQAEATSHGVRAPIKRMMEQWLEKPGFPIVDVRVADGKAKLSQSRFTISGKVDSTPWMIPIRYLTRGGASSMLMRKRNATLGVDGDWIKLNHNQSGFYRCSYDNGTLHRLGGMLADGKLGALDGWGLENDLFAEVRAGFRRLDEYLDFVESYCGGAEAPLSTSISSHLAWINNISYGQTFGVRARRTGLNYYREALARLGWGAKPGESITDAKLRNDAIKELSKLGDRDTSARAVHLFQSYASGKLPVDPNISGAVYYAAAVVAPSTRTLSQLIGIYKSNPSLEEKKKAVWGMGLLSDDVMLRNALRFAFSKGMRLQDSVRVIAAAPENPATTGALANWLVLNWKMLMKTYPPSLHMLTWCTKGFFGVRDADTRGRVASLFGKKDSLRGDIDLLAKQAIEEIDANIRFLQTNS